MQPSNPSPTNHQPPAEPHVQPGHLVAAELPHAHSPPAANVQPKRGTGGWLALAAVLVLLALGMGFLIVNHRRTAAEAALTADAQAASDAPITLDVVKVRYAPAARVITVPGECRAWYETTIYARVSGYLQKWDVDIGDSVKAGQLLATIETPEMDQQLAADVAKVEAEKAQVVLAKSSVHFSQITLARFKDAPKGIVSDLERDQKDADYQTSLARLTASESDLNSAQADVDRINAMLAFKKVIAPFDGVITQRRVDLGDLVTAGSTANTTPLFVLKQTDHIRVFVDLPEDLVPQIHDGDAAFVESKEYPGQVFDGKAARNARAINEQSKTLRMEVDVPNKDMRLLPGMFVRVNFKINDKENPLLIPASAIAFRSGGPQVAVVANDGRVSFHPVTILRDLGDSIEVRQGVSENDQVALNINSEIASGDVVKFNNVELPGLEAPAPQTALSANLTKTVPEKSGF